MRFASVNSIDIYSVTLRISFGVRDGGQNNSIGGNPVFEVFRFVRSPQRLSLCKKKHIGYEY